MTPSSLNFGVSDCMYPPLNSQACVSHHQTYSCSSECSEHLIRHSHIRNTQPSHTAGPIEHHYPGAHQHTVSSMAPHGNETTRFEESNDNAAITGTRLNTFQCSNIRTQSFTKLFESEHASKLCENHHHHYNYIYDVMNSSSREGSTCSCSEGACLNIEPDKPSIASSPPTNINSVN